MKNLVAATLFAITVWQPVAAQFKQAPLPYPYTAFEEVIDAKTMEIHYTKHAAGYTSNLNNAITGTPLEKESLEGILAGISKQTAAVRNNAGGHYNHELFWTVLTANKNTKPSEQLSKAITQTFGSLDKLKEALNKEATGRFGSGWAWLIVTADKKLAISSTPNQDNPVMDVADVKGTPIFGIDVWEHAYYLQYQNKRADYLSAIWSIVNWEEVSK